MTALDVGGTVAAVVHVGALAEERALIVEKRDRSIEPRGGVKEPAPGSV